MHINSNLSVGIDRNRYSIDVGVGCGDKRRSKLVLDLIQRATPPPMRFVLSSRTHT